MNEHAESGGRRRSAIREVARRRPVTLFLAIGIGLTWPLEFALLVNGLDLTPGLLAELVFLLGGATLVTALADGRAGVRRLFAGVVRWRIGLARFVVLSAAMPVLTLLVGAITGTLRAPADGWPALVGAYLFQTFVFGLLLANLWEETAWGGFVQSRLMARHGLLIGSLLTAVPFFLIHIPLAFAAHGWTGTTWAEAALDLALIALAAPFFRYLAGTQLVDTGGSILAIGLLHASFNAAGQMSAVPGGWQYIPAMILLTLAVIAYRRWRGRSFVHGYVPVTVTGRPPPSGSRSRPRGSQRSTIDRPGPSAAAGSVDLRPRAARADSGRGMEADRRQPAGAEGRRGDPRRGRGGGIGAPAGGLSHVSRDRANSLTSVPSIRFGGPAGPGREGESRG